MEQVTRHPWAKWFRLRKFILHHGVDYTCMPHAMAQQIRNRASDYGYSASIVIKPDGALHVRIGRS